jgi:nucleoid DNA-binding protein
MLKIDLYKNTIRDSRTFGKVYGRITPGEMFSLEKLAKHMSEHNTPYSKGVIKGIMTDMVSCIKELLLDGNSVKIDDLAIFKAKVNTTPADTYDKFDCGSNVKSVSLAILATGSSTRANMTKDATVGLSKYSQSLREEQPEP